FRQTSVVDRPYPEYWGGIFDRVTRTARAHGDLVELDYSDSDGAAYGAANVAIIDEARMLAEVRNPTLPSGTAPLIALVVWEASPRGSDDNTAQLAELAGRAGFRIETVLTIHPEAASF